jgi:hypothetical protein
MSKAVEGLKSLFDVMNAESDDEEWEIPWFLQTKYWPQSPQPSDDLPNIPVDVEPVDQPVVNLPADPPKFPDFVFKCCGILQIVEELKKEEEEKRISEEIPEDI